MEYKDPSEAIIKLILDKLRRASITYADIEDIGQVLRVHWQRARLNYDPNKSSIESFASVVLSRKAKDALRSILRRQAHFVTLDATQADVFPSPEVPPDHALMNKEVVEEVARLPLPQRQVAILLMQGYSPNEIQRVMPLTRRKFERILSELRLKLRDYR